MGLITCLICLEAHDEEHMETIKLRGPDAEIYRTVRLCPACISEIAAVAAALAAKIREREQSESS